MLAMAAAVPGQSASRVIRGMVIDVRDQPIPAVAVVASGGAAAITDDSGRFRLEIPHRDKVVFDVRRLGYMPSRVGLVPGGDTTLSVLLLPSAQPLPAMNVTGRDGRALSLIGFEQRMLERQRGAGTGHFITAKEIDGMAATRASQVVEATPSILVRRTRDRFGSSNNFTIYGKGVGRSGECPATVYLDGIRLNGAGRVVGTRDAVSIDDYVTPNEIAGVEIYARGALAPVQFQPASDASALLCAIVVFWTKHS
jgi:hypothetical protein